MLWRQKLCNYWKNASWTHQAWAWQFPFLVTKNTLLYFTVKPCNIIFFFAIVGQVIDFRNIFMILKSWKCFIIILTKGVEENMEINSISALLSLLLPGNSQLGQTTCPMKMDDIPAFHKWKHIFSTAIVLFPQVASVNKQFILHWQDNLVFYKSFDVIKKKKSNKAEGLCSLAPWLYGKESVLNCINSPDRLAEPKLMIYFTSAYSKKNNCMSSQTVCASMTRESNRKQCSCLPNLVFVVICFVLQWNVFNH